MANSEDKPRIIRPRNRGPKEIEPSVMQCRTVITAGEVFDTAANVRGYSVNQLAEMMQAPRQTVTAKRHGLKPLTLWDIEILSRALDIPPEMFLLGVSSLLDFLASQRREWEEKGGLDLRKGSSTCNYVSAGHVPEIVIDLRDSASDRVPTGAF
jgi:plasmid maintenance system antidote protein VapI